MNINWKGISYEEFTPTVGLRQGTLLCPYLFVIAIGCLRRCILGATQNNSWKSIKFGRDGPSVSHMMFIDDIILIVEAFIDQTTTINDILTTFCSHSRKQVSPSKSKRFLFK